MKEITCHVYIFRCLLLMAELKCLSEAPAAALGHIYEALEIAYSFCADHFVTLCLTHIASIQVSGKDSCICLIILDHKYYL